MKDNPSNNKTHYALRLPSSPSPPPNFRAMAMVAGAESRLFRSPSEDVNQKSRTFEKQPQPGLASGSDIFRDSEVTTHEDRSSSLKNAVAATTLTSPIWQAGWQNPVLTRLGLYHPLEQCQTTFPKIKMPEVLASLTNAFQALSLQTVLVNSPIAANCISLEQVHWRVSMWESRTDANSCVMEVQRCKGDAVIFVRYAKQIIAVVAQAATEATDFATTTFQPSMRTTPSMPTLVQAERMLGHTFSEETDATAFYGALEIADRLIGADRFDAQCLGLESLGVMTDPEKTGMAGASLVSWVVLTGRAPPAAGQVETADAAVYQRLQRAVVTAVATGSSSSSKSMEQDVDSMDLDNDNNQVSYYLALVICANAVSVLSQDAAALEQFLADAERLTGGCNLLECLVGQVHACQEQAHLAYLATRILHGLCQACPVVRGALMKQKAAVQVVQHAQQVGSVTHAALEDITGQLLVDLHA
jgi:hypothetical protein